MDTLKQKTTRRFQKAVAALERALALGELPDHAERDTTLLRFELAAELMPKVLQRVLSEHGADVVLPKDTVRAARAARLFDETQAEVLLAVIDDRNRMVHDYSEEFAEGLYARIKNQYAGVIRSLSETLQ